ncbi:MAG: Asp-tRNA(Asn)/Glu-tRNA(Gln) amidotransferase subunit GatA [Elusimicrobiota bacterium]
MKLHEQSALQIAKGVRDGSFTAQEVVESSLIAIAKQQPPLNAYITVLESAAIESAKKVDLKKKSGQKLGPLAGVPVAIKDNIMIAGVRTTCASKILGDYKAPYNAHIIDQFNDADAVFVGKTNMDEFAMGSSTEHSQFGLTRNPWNKDCIPGGSSGGSAVAVASRTVPISIGSDTGGSIRQPASLCGVLGLKPTYGRVSRYGLVAFASSLDQIGPFTHSPEDMALAMSVISGWDAKDSTSVDRPVPAFESEINQPLKGLRIGIPKEYFVSGMDPEVEKATRDAAEILKNLGCEIVEVSLPHSEMALAVYYIIAPSEASSNLARFDGMRFGFRNNQANNLIEQYAFNRRDGFGPEVKRRIMIGTYALSSGYYDAFYLKAQKVRTLIKQDFENVFKSVDALITPVAPTPAFKIGEKVDDPLTMYLSDIFTIPANLAGVPGISIPAGFSSKGLPIGVQFLSDIFNDSLLMRISNLFLKETQWHQKAPLQ